MIGFYKQVTELLSAAGYYYCRPGKGSHEIWAKGSLRLTVPTHCSSRHTANAVLKQAMLSARIR
jgi:predicted RNA binding protein YcfA (HicA-like mRNA interferase family)